MKARKTLLLTALALFAFAGCKEKAQAANGAAGSETAESASGDSAWYMAQTDSAAVESIVATSELVEAQFEGKYLYPPINILDGNFETVWCEADKNGSGIGEEITVAFSEPVSFDEIQMVNGFASRDYYQKNNRVKSILLTQTAPPKRGYVVSERNGETIVEVKNHFQQKEYTLADGKPEWQSIHSAKTLTIKITGVYRGDKYDDTCLADIRLLYKGSVIPFKNVENLKKIQEANSRKMILQSDGSEFKKEFFALFEGEDNLYLRESDGGYIYIQRSGDDIRFWHYFPSHATKILPVKSTKEEMESLFKAEFSQWFKDNGDSYSPAPLKRLLSCWDDIKEANVEYVRVGYGDWHERRTEYSLGNHRLLTTEYIDYVATTTATILDIEDGKVFVNGEAYTPLSQKRVYNATYGEW